MKNIAALFIVIFFSGSAGFAQSKVDIGINGHLGIPVGEMANRLDMGFGGGLWFVIPVSSPMVGIAMGASYESYPGKNVTTTSSGSWGYESTTTIYGTTGLGSIFAGPKIGKENGPYFLPAISMNIQTEVRFGIDIGGGFLVPFGPGMTKLNVGAKYSMINLIGTNDGEISASGIRIVAGIVF